MKTYNLFLDDVRNPGDAFVPGVRRKDIGTIETKSLLELTNTESSDWVVVRTYEEFAKTLNEFGIPSVVSLDHDLCMEHIKYYFRETVLSGIIEYANLTVRTGYHCAQLLVKECKRLNVQLPKYYVHSANSVGAENIQTVLENF